MEELRVKLECSEANHLYKGDSHEVSTLSVEALAKAVQDLKVGAVIQGLDTVSFKTGIVGLTLLWSESDITKMHPPVINYARTYTVHLSDSLIELLLKSPNILTINCNIDGNKEFGFICRKEQQGRPGEVLIGQHMQSSVIIPQDARQRYESSVLIDDDIYAVRDLYTKKYKALPYDLKEAYPTYQKYLTALTLKEYLADAALFYDYANGIIEWKHTECDSERLDDLSYPTYWKLWSDKSDKKEAIGNHHNMQFIEGGLIVELVDKLKIYNSDWAIKEYRAGTTGMMLSVACGYIKGNKNHSGAKEHLKYIMERVGSNYNIPKENAELLIHYLDLLGDADMHVIFKHLVDLAEPEGSIITMSDLCDALHDTEAIQEKIDAIEAKPDKIDLEKH